MGSPKEVFVKFNFLLKRLGFIVKSCQKEVGNGPVCFFTAHRNPNPSKLVYEHIRFIGQSHVIPLDSRVFFRVQFLAGSLFKFLLCHAAPPSGGM
jgi:hypothetical protein